MDLLYPKGRHRDPSDVAVSSTGPPFMHWSKTFPCPVFKERAIIQAWLLSKSCVDNPNWPIGPLSLSEASLVIKNMRCHHIPAR